MKRDSRKSISGNQPKPKSAVAKGVDGLKKGVKKCGDGVRKGMTKWVSSEWQNVSPHPHQMSPIQADLDPRRTTFSKNSPQMPNTPTIGSPRDGKPGKLRGHHVSPVEEKENTAPNRMTNDPALTPLRRAATYSKLNGKPTRCLLGDSGCKILEDREEESMPVPGRVSNGKCRVWSDNTHVIECVDTEQVITTQVVETVVVTDDVCQQFDDSLDDVDSASQATPDALRHAGALCVSPDIFVTRHIQSVQVRECMEQDVVVVEGETSPPDMLRHANGHHAVMQQLQSVKLGLADHMMQSTPLPNTGRLSFDSAIKRHKYQPSPVPTPRRASAHGFTNIPSPNKSHRKLSTETFNKGPIEKDQSWKELFADIPETNPRRFSTLTVTKVRPHTAGLKPHTLVLGSRKELFESVTSPLNQRRLSNMTVTKDHPDILHLMKPHVENISQEENDSSHIPGNFFL